MTTMFSMSSTASTCRWPNRSAARTCFEFAASLGVNFLLPFNDRYIETPIIHLNQVGYNPHSTKRYAYISGWMGDGHALPLDNFPTEAEILLDDAIRPWPSECQ